jgi:hypothetical protein
MGLKPPVQESGKRGWRSRRSVRVGSLIAAGSLAVGLAGFGLTAATPAMADPATLYVTVGSDTTQFIINSWALQVLGGDILASYNATNPDDAIGSEAITPSKVVNTSGVLSQMNCSFTRPNGSGQGLNALRWSLNPSTGAANLPANPSGTSSPTNPENPVNGTYCVDFSRSSSAPTFIGQGTTASPSGQLIFIPFAYDTFAMATGPGTTIVDASSVTKAELVSLYACTDTTVGANVYSPSHDGTGIAIDMMVPQSGSGTRAWWLFNIGGATTPGGSTLNTCTHDTIQAGTNSGQANEENTGLAYASDPAAFGPYSVANWVAQAKGAETDLRDGAVLNSVDGVAPTTGSLATSNLAVNPAGTLNREVFNVVAYDRVVNTGDGNFDPVLSGLLNGATSRMCTAGTVIAALGFLRLNTPGLPAGTDACGVINNNLRIQPSTGSGYAGV